MEPRHVLGGLDTTPEVLAAQGRALRGLARSLLRDEHAAEDVVQETWLACLDGPAGVRGRPRALGGWLATVTRHLALRRVRGDGRRERREARAAAPERLEALQQRTLEREEALRAVTDALLALEEPFKTALFLRYFEERTPGAIASELDVPVATVKSRLARGLERLRARLGPAFGGDETKQRRALRALAALPAPAALVPVSPGAPGAAKTAVAAGAVSAGVKLPAAAAALALACGALWWWSDAPDGRAEGKPLGREPASAARSGAGAASAPNGTTLAPAADGARADEPRREALADAPGEAAAEPLDAFPPEAAFAYRVHGRVRDARDLPLEGARVLLAPRGLPFNHAATTDAEGRFDVAFAGRRGALDCALAVEGGGGLALREVRLVAGRPLEVDVGLRGGHEAVVALESLETVTVRTGGLLQELRIVHGPRADLGDAPEMRRHADGRSSFVAPPPELACPRPSEHELAFERILLSSAALELRPQFIVADQLELRVALQSFISAGGEDAEPRRAAVRGTVRDAAGRPLAGVEVGWGPPGHALAESVRTDAEGAFALEDVPAGEVRLRAGGGDHTVASERLELAGGEQRAWSPILPRGAAVVGRVAGPSSAPLAGARVELWGSGPAILWSDTTLADAEGRFAFPDAPAGALDLLVYAPGAEPGTAFPRRVVRPVHAGTDVGTLALADDALHALALDVRDAAGEPADGAELRAWHASALAGRVVRGRGEDGRLRLAGLPPGPYRVEVVGPAGWRDLGTVWVDGEDLDLGVERFPSAGLLELAGEPETDLRASVWSAHPDVFALVAAADLHGEWRLPLRAGEHVLCVAGPRGARAEAPLAIRPGIGTALALEPAEDGAPAVLPRAPLATRAPLAARAPLAIGDADALARERCAACHGPPPAETALVERR